MKKAQGLSLNTIVIGAVVLIVLIVVVGIFTGYFNKFVPGLVSASQQECSGDNFRTDVECDSLTEQQVYGNFGDSVSPGKVCCKRVAVECSGFDLYCDSSCGGDEELKENIAGLKYVCSGSSTHKCCFRGVA